MVASPMNFNELRVWRRTKSQKQCAYLGLRTDRALVSNCVPDRFIFRSPLIVVTKLEFRAGGHYGTNGHDDSKNCPANPEAALRVRFWTDFWGSTII